LSIRHDIFLGRRNIFPHLVVLHVDDVTDLSMECICTLKSLCFLYIKSTGKYLSESGMKFLGNLLNLRELHISSFYSLKGTRNGFANLYRLESLEILNISLLNIHDDDMKHISQVVSLKKVKFGTETQLTDDGIDYLSQLSNLE